MFEIDIRTAAYQGVKLHRHGGTEYWKLRLTCTAEECPNEIEMGECLCFHCEDDMAKARDNHGMFCSAKCWIASTDKERVAQVLTNARKAMKELPLEEREGWVYDMGDDHELLDGYWQYMAEVGAYDGSEFFEDFDVQDCPI